MTSHPASKGTRVKTQTDHKLGFGQVKLAFFFTNVTRSIPSHPSDYEYMNFMTILIEK